MKTLYLSSKGLNHTISSIDENDFTFIVGNKEYRCSHFQACFISPKIHSVLLSDPMFDTFEIEINDDDEKFNDVMNLMKGQSIELDKATCLFLKEIGKILENQEIIDEAVNFDIKQIDKNNVFDIIKQKKKFGSQYTKEMKFIAQNFCECSLKNLLTLSVDEIREILSMNDNLELASEDSLFEKVISMIESNNEYIEVLDCIALENLSITYLLKYINTIKTRFVTQTVWENLCDRMKKDLYELETYQNSDQQPKFKLFKLNPKAPLNGIFAYLNKTYGDICKNQIVSISASSEGGPKPSLVINQQWNQYFFTKNIPNSWICFDFGNHRVSVTDYSIKSAPYGPNACHLKNWVLEGSDDLNYWMLMDKRVNDNSLNAASAVKSYKVGKRAEFRYIRLRIIGVDHQGKNFLQLSSIELFGEFY